VKGTISEAELFTLQSRLREGRWNKARRGEYPRPLPVGFVCTQTGEVVKDPDRQVQARIDYIFRLFSRLKVAGQVLAHLNRAKLKMPVKVTGGPHHGTVVWKMADAQKLSRLLHNPTYAGAYVYGRTSYDGFDRSPQTGRAKSHVRSPQDWPVCLRDFYPAYITWEQFQQNLQTLRSNVNRRSSQGAPRQGKALLQGIAYCGRCGVRMTVFHYSHKEPRRTPMYKCIDAYRQYALPTCQHMSAKVVDQAVTNLFLNAVSPAKIEIALRALEEMDSDRAAALKQWDLQLQRADYDAELARRRYESADPENRLVASELEARWEEALRQREQLRREREEFEHRQVQSLSDADRQRIKELSGDLGKVWHAETTSMQERKALIRFLIKRVHLDGVTEKGRIRIDVEWHTGAHSTMTIDRPPVGIWGGNTPLQALERIRELFLQHEYSEVAAILNAEGFRTAQGKAFDHRIVRYLVRKRLRCRKYRRRGQEDESRS
jgi:hypothetical protein